MITRIIPSIITATGNIIATNLSLFIERWFLPRSKHNSFSRISNARIDKLHNSVWKGKFRVNGRIEETEMSIKFSVKKNLVKGVGTYIKPFLGETRIILEGSFVSDNLLRLDYKNSEDYKLHFGTMILEMNGDASELVGGLLSYGRSPDKVYHGSITLLAL